MKEPEAYRIVLESLLAHSNGKRVFTQSETARYLHKSRGWVRTHLDIGRDGIIAEGLAWKLSKTLS